MAITGAKNLAKAEDSAHSSGDVGVAVMTVRKNTAVALAADGDYQPLLSDSDGKLHIAGSITVSSTAGVAAEDAAASGNPVLVGGRYDSSARTLDNGDVGAIALDADGAVQIADGGNAITIDGTVTASNTAGDIAHSAADSGNPIKVGGKAVNTDGTAPGTAVTENDRANFITDVYGRQCVQTTHPNLWSATDNQSSAQTNTVLKATPGSGLSLYITDVVISNGATAGNIKFVESTASSPVDKIEVMYFAINGGAALHFQTPIKLTANKDFGYTSVDCTTHSVTINGYIAP